MKYTVEEPGGSRVYTQAFTPLMARQRAKREFSKRGKVVDIVRLVVLHGWV